MEALLPRYPVGIERTAKIEQHRFDRLHLQAAAGRDLCALGRRSRKVEGFAVDKGIARVVRDAVTELARGGFHKIGRRRFERPAYPAVQSQLGATQSVDDD